MGGGVREQPAGATGDRAALTATLGATTLPDTAMLIHGQCHCGNIAFALNWEPDPVEIPARACDCSFCQKHGGVWTAYPDGQLKVTLRNPAQVSRYSFGTRTADFLTCTQCGVVPVATSLIDGHLFAVVSVNAMEGVDPTLFRRATASFDGEDQASRLARRKRHWIGQVEIVEGTG
ncbi:GFA family protein [Dyella silvae]|uniref:GFA family protein n=1 Tax=Dyella silvae TaxID=2994424 RepID=UPI002263E30B|nr:hypothetical protein [Dyella silvae]